VLDYFVSLYILFSATIDAKMICHGSLAKKAWFESSILYGHHRAWWPESMVKSFLLS